MVPGQGECFHHDALPLLGISERRRCRVSRGKGHHHRVTRALHIARDYEVGKTPMPQQKLAVSQLHYDKKYTRSRGKWERNENPMHFNGSREINDDFPSLINVYFVVLMLIGPRKLCRARQILRPDHRDSEDVWTVHGRVI